MGTIDAQRILFGPSGVHIVGNPGEAGTVVVTGDYVLSAGALLSFDVGANAHDHLVIGGHASLAGTISVALLNGFVPEAEPEPDRFEIITFASADGAFENSSIDLGNGLYFLVDIGPENVTLVTSTVP
jgi:outer membrane autotransporter protein